MSSKSLRVTVSIEEQEFSGGEDIEYNILEKNKPFNDVDDLVDFLEREAGSFRDGYEELVDAMNEYRKIRSLEVGKLYRLSTGYEDDLVINATFKIEKADKSSLEELNEALFDLVR